MSSATPPGELISLGVGTGAYPGTGGKPVEMSLGAGMGACPVSPPGTGGKPLGDEDVMSLGAGMGACLGAGTGS